MKPSKISYSESKESVDSIGLKSWRKAGVEIELGSDDNEIDAFKNAKVIIDKVLYPITSNPEFQKVADPFHAPLPTIDYAKEDVKLAIGNCESLYELDLLMGDIAKHNLVPQYLEKKKLLK